MIIHQRRVRNVSKYLGFLTEGTRLVIGLSSIGQYADKLVRVGFCNGIQIGEAVLPASTFGPISLYNAEGKYIIHRDQPKETAYRVVEWHWREFRGRDDYEEMSGDVDVPYKRYPRTFVPPPSIELSIAADANGEPVLVTPPQIYQPDNSDIIRHTINLFLEIFGICEVFTEGLAEVVRPPIRRLNWAVLPPGQYPWERVLAQLEPTIRVAKEGNQGVIQRRLEVLHSYHPEFMAIGEAGFTGYVIYGYPQRNLYVCENTLYGNATYIFGQDWIALSQMTKAEVLDENRQRARVIHRENWQVEIQQVFAEG
jgi:hypothetical protein